MKLSLCTKIVSIQVPRVAYHAFAPLPFLCHLRISPLEWRLKPWLDSNSILAPVPGARPRESFLMNATELIEFRDGRSSAHVPTNVFECVFPCSFIRLIARVPPLKTQQPFTGRFKRHAGTPYQYSSKYNPTSFMT